MSQEKPMITQMVFDTNCVLCSGSVHFILRHERDQAIQFVNAWSPVGGALAQEHGLDEAALNDTILVVEGGAGLIKSDAVLAIACHLRAPWSWVRIIRFVPRTIRDILYIAIATRRYRMFGHAEGCFVPPAHMRDRFVDT